MTDEQQDAPQPSRRRGRTPAGNGGSSPKGPAPSGSSVDPTALPPSDDDPLAALERLQSMTPGASPRTAAVESAPPRRPAALASPPRTRPRPAATSGGSRTVARIAAPAVFLVAVVVVLSLVFQSGVLGGKAGPTPTPQPTVSKTKNGGGTTLTYRKYTVKSGDTLSGIASKFNVATTDIEALNPKLSTSTLIVGTIIRVPKTTQ